MSDHCRQVLLQHLENLGKQKPKQLTITQLKSGLGEAGIELPTSQQKKKVYVELYKEGLSRKRKRLEDREIKKRRRSNVERKPTRLVQPNLPKINIFQKSRTEDDSVDGELTPMVDLVSSDSSFELEDDTQELNQIQSPQQEGKLSRARRERKEQRIREQEMRQNSEIIQAPRNSEINASSGRNSSQVSSESNAATSQSANEENRMTEFKKRSTGNRRRKSENVDSIPKVSAPFLRKKQVGEKVPAKRDNSDTFRKKQLAASIRPKGIPPRTFVADDLIFHKPPTFTWKEKILSASKYISFASIFWIVVVIIALQFYNPQPSEKIEVKPFCTTDVEFSQADPADCITCPGKGYCLDGILVDCEPSYLRINDDCIFNEEVTAEARKMYLRLRDSLVRKKGEWECGYISQPGLKKDELHQELEPDYLNYPRSDKPAFTVVYDKLMDFIDGPNSQLQFRQEKDGHVLISKNSILPIKCRMMRFFRRYQLQIFVINLVLILTLYMYWRFQNKRWYEEVLRDIVSVILEKLRKEKKIVIVHMRDDLQEKKKDWNVRSFWNDVEDLIAQDSRVTVEMDKYHQKCWMWDGSNDEPEPVEKKEVEETKPTPSQVISYPNLNPVDQSLSHQNRYVEDSHVPNSYREPYDNDAFKFPQNSYQVNNNGMTEERYNYPRTEYDRIKEESFNYPNSNYPNSNYQENPAHPNYQENLAHPNYQENHGYEPRNHNPFPKPKRYKPPAKPQNQNPYSNLI